MKALKITAAIMKVAETAAGRPRSSPKEIAESLRDIGTMAQEGFFLISLDTQNREINRHMIALGGLTGAVVDPRIVFRAALADGAASIIVAHNHPSGMVTPSQADRGLTDRLTQGGEILGVTMLDHFIIGKDAYYSFSVPGEFEF